VSAGEKARRKRGGEAEVKKREGKERRRNLTGIIPPPGVPSAADHVLELGKRGILQEKLWEGPGKGESNKNITRAML